MLRKPSVTVYGSVAAALLYVYLHPTRETARAVEAGDRFVERSVSRPRRWVKGGTL